MFGLINKRTSSTNNYSLQNDYKSTSINSDDRAAGDNGAIVTRGNVSVLDGGAISGALQLAATTGSDMLRGLTTIGQMSTANTGSSLEAMRATASNAMMGNREIASLAMKENGFTTTQALNYGRSTTDRALSYAGDAFDDAYYSLNRGADQAFDMAEKSNANTQSTLTSLLAMDREQSAHLSEKLINIAVPLGVVFAIAWAVKK